MDLIITNVQQLLEFLADYDNLEQVKDSLSKTESISQINVTRTLQQALKEAGAVVELGLLEEYIQDRHRLLSTFPEQAVIWDRQLIDNPPALLGKTQTAEDILSYNPTEDFITEVNLNARDPFRAMKSFATNFKPLTEINSFNGTNRLNSVRTAEVYRNVGEYYTGRLEKTINQDGSLFKSLDSRAAVYGQSSGYYSRATETDYYNIFAGEERRAQGFKGSFFQLQETSTLTALYNRPGKTDIVTQSLTSQDYLHPDLLSEDENVRAVAEDDVRTKMDIFSGNSLAISLAHRYGAGNNQTTSQLSIKPLTMPGGGSAHAKMGYFYDKDDDDITSILISTQNITPALSRTTTIEDMLLINKPLNIAFRDRREDEDQGAYQAEYTSYNDLRNRRVDAFDVLSKQLKAATDAMLSIQTTTPGGSGADQDRSRQFIGEFRNRIAENYSSRAGKGGVFANHEILPALQGIIKSAAEDKGRYVSMSMQYLEKALVEGSVLGTDTFGHLRTLAESNRLRIGVSGSSIGSKQGLFYMLHALDTGGASEQSKNLIRTLIKNDAFTLLPTQLQHSKSLAVFDKKDEQFNLFQYFLGSANIGHHGMGINAGPGTGEATTKNIEVSMLLQGDYLDLLSEEDRENISDNYLHGIGHSFSKRSRQGALVERRGDAKQVNRAISLLSSLGAIDAQDSKNKDVSGPFSYSRRYVLDSSTKDGYRLTGLDLVIKGAREGDRGYTLGITVGTEYKFVTDGPGAGTVKEVPVLFINKSQRMINGIVYKNASEETLGFQAYNLDKDAVEQINLQRDHSYVASALDVLGGMVSTMHTAMQYDAEVRSLVTTFKGLEADDLRRSVDTMLSETIQADYRLGHDNKKLMDKSANLAATLSKLKKLDQRDARATLGRVADTLGAHGWKGSEGAEGGGARFSEMKETLVDGLMKQLYGKDADTGKAAGDVVNRIYELVADSLGLGDRNNPTATNRMGLYSDMALDLIKRTGVGYAMYQEQVELGRGEIYHRMVDAFQQPHTQNYSQGQALHALPVYGMTNVVARRQRPYLPAIKGLILNPYSLMHGESLGTQVGADGRIIGGQYYREKGKGAGKAVTEQYFEAYGGLQKIEGGAPVVYDTTGLAASMPTMTAIKRKAFQEKTASFLKALGKKNAEQLANQLTATTFDMYNEAETLTGSTPEEEQILYYFPYAKTEQITARLKNLSSTRPMFDASNAFIKYALGFGTGDYTFNDPSDIIDGALLGSMPEQQFESLKQEYDKRLAEWKKEGSPAGKEPTYLSIAKEWSINSRRFGKGYIGSARPRLLAIAAGATQLSDYGIYNPFYNQQEGDQDDGGYEYGMKYLKPHPIQVSGTLSGNRTSPTNLLSKVQEYLKPGTIFIARDSLIKNNDLLNTYAGDLAKLIQRNLGLGENPDAFGLTGGDLTEDVILKRTAEYYVNSSPEGGLDAKLMAQTAYNAARAEFKSRHKQVRMGFDNDADGNKLLTFKMKKGVYRPGGGGLDPKDDLSTPLESIGDVEPGDSQFTLRAFSVFDEDGQSYRVSPLKIAITAHSARELNAYTVLGESSVTSNANNTFLLNIETYSIEDFMSGMRPGTILPKGPFKGGKKELFETLASLYQGSSTDLLPTHMQRKNSSGAMQKYSAADIFAYVAPSQIKGFNFEMGLSLLSGSIDNNVRTGLNSWSTSSAPVSSGTSPLLNRLTDGKQIAQSLALMFLGTKASDMGGDNNRQLLLRSLAGSLDSNESQYATALRIKADKLKGAGGAFNPFTTKFQTSGLSMFSPLAGLVDMGQDEGLESALLRTIISALRNEGDARDKLAKQSKGLLNYILKEGSEFVLQDKDSDRISIKDTFETKPLGLLAFLAKASSDLYQDVDPDKRAEIGGLGEVVLNRNNVFHDPDKYFRSGNGDRSTELNGIINLLKNVSGSNIHQTANLRRSLYENLVQLQKVTGGNLQPAYDKMTMLHDDKIAGYANEFTELVKRNGFAANGRDENPSLSLERLTHSGGIAGALMYMQQDADHTKLVGADKQRGSSIYQAVVGNLGKKLGTPEASLTDREVITRLNDDSATLQPQLQTAIKEELGRLHSQPGEPVDILNNIFSNSAYGIADLGALQGAVDLFKGGDPVLSAKKKGTVGLYSALEAYAGLAGSDPQQALNLQQAQQTMVNAFGYILPKSSLVRNILQRQIGGEVINEQETSILREVEFSLAAISDSIQQQRAILMPAEFAMSKIATPTGSKNTTALEGHLARSMTKKQLSMYTYSPNEYSQVGSVQEALFTLSRIYEGALPSDDRITSKYALQLYNLSFGETAASFLQQNQGSQQPGLVRKSQNIQQFHQSQHNVIDFLANYNPLFRKTFGGEYLQSDPGVTLLLGLQKGSADQVKQHMQKVNQIVLGEVGSADMPYEDQLDRRVNLLAEYIYDQRGAGAKDISELDGGILKRYGGRITDVNSYASSVLRDSSGYSEEEVYAARLWQESDVIYDDPQINRIRRSRLRTGLLNRRRSAALQNITSVGGLRARIKHAQSTNEGAGYLEAVKSQYALAQQLYNNGRGNSKGQAEAFRQMTILKSSRFIALPSYSIIDSDFQGNITIGRTHTELNQGLTTGVILGLDVLEKMSLLFQTDSHPALSAQHRLISQLSRTQGLIDKVERQIIQGGSANLTPEEMQELQTLQVLMETSKATTIDILQNKNSIRQSTANRLNMMGASYIAINSLLVGQKEIAIGDRAKRHIGSETTGGSARFVGSIRPSINKINELMHNPYARNFLIATNRQAELLQKQIDNLPEGDPKRAELVRQQSRWLTLSGAPQEEQLNLIDARISSLKGFLDYAVTVPVDTNTVKGLEFTDNIQAKQQELKNLTTARGIAKSSAVLVATMQNEIGWDDRPELAGAKGLLRHVLDWATSKQNLDSTLPSLVKETQAMLDGEYIDKNAYIEWANRVQSLQGRDSKELDISSLKLVGLTLDARKTREDSAARIAAQEQVVADNESTLRALNQERESTVKQLDSVNRAIALQKQRLSSGNRKTFDLASNRLTSANLQRIKLKRKLDRLSPKKGEIKAAKSRLKTSRQHLNNLQNLQDPKHSRRVRKQANMVLKLLDNARFGTYASQDEIAALRTTTQSLIQNQYIKTEDFLSWQEDVMDAYNKYHPQQVSFSEILPIGGLEELDAHRNALRRTVLEFNTVDRLATLRNEALEERRLRRSLRRKRVLQSKHEARVKPLTDIKKTIAALEARLATFSIDTSMSGGELLKIQQQLGEAQAKKAALEANTKIQKSQKKLEGHSDKPGLIVQLQTDQTRYDKIASRAKTYSALNEWAERLKDLAQDYGENRYYAKIDAAYVLDTIERTGLRMDLLELQIITGKHVDNSNKKKIIEEVESKGLMRNALAGRQGAPYWSFTSSRGAAPGTMGYDHISINDEYNQRAAAAGSLFGTDDNSSSTLMMVSAFGFQFVGLGDFDGDSYQVALTSITKQRGAIAKIDENIRSAEQHLGRLSEQIKQASGEQKRNVQNQITAVKAQIADLNKHKKAEQNKLDEVRRLNQVTNQKKVAGAKAGVRSYIADFLALPSYLIGRDEDADRVAFTDSELAGTVKQYRDTMSGFYDRQDDTDKVAGAFAYLETKEITVTDNVSISGSSGTTKTKRTVLNLDEEALPQFNKEQLSTYTDEDGKEIRIRSEAETERLVARAKDWHEAFLKYGNAGSAFGQQELEEMNIEEYRGKITKFVTSIEAANMSMSTASKILKNASGSQVSSVNLETIQEVIGETGGGLLGKVYNTVVPTVTNQISDHLMNRIMTDPVAMEDFENSIKFSLEAAKNSANGTNQPILVQTLEAIQNKTGRNREPWEIIQKRGQKKAGAAYRFILTTQQFLRDAAIKPKSGIGLVEASNKFSLSPQAIKQIQDLNITGLNIDELQGTQGYDKVLGYEFIGRKQDKGRQYLEIVSQDFLGKATSTVLNNVYGAGKPGYADQEMTSFAMLRLITDYAGGSGISPSEMLNDENYLYGAGLQDARKNIIARAESDTTFADSIGYVPGSGHISADTTVRHTIADLIGRFQSDFILSSVMENQTRTTIDQTTNALRSHGITLNVSGEGNNTRYSFGKDNSLLQETVNYQLEEDIEAYNRTLKLEDSENKLTLASLTVSGPATSAETQKAIETLRQNQTDYQAELERIQGKLLTTLNPLVTDGDNAGDITSALSTGALEEANAILTQRTFETINYDTTQEQAQDIVEQLAKVREFNQMVADVKKDGATNDFSSMVFQAVHGAAVAGQQALLADLNKLGIFSENLQATAYATDTGKLSSEGLYRAFSTGITAISEAINEDTTLNNDEAKAVYSYMAMGGMLPEPIESAYDEAVDKIRGLGQNAGDSEETIQQNIDDYRTSFIKSLAVAGEKVDEFGGKTRVPSTLETIAENSGYVAASAGWISIAEQANAMLDNPDMLSEGEHKQSMDIAMNAAEKLEAIQNRKLSTPQAPPTIPGAEESTLNMGGPLESPSTLMGPAPTINTQTQTTNDQVQTTNVVTPTLTGVSDPPTVDTPPSSPDIDIPENIQRVESNPAFEVNPQGMTSRQYFEGIDAASAQINQLSKHTQNRQEVVQRQKQNFEKKGQLQKAFGISEALSILAVPTLFAAMQGDIPIGEQVTGFVSDAAQSLITMGSFEQSTIGSMYRGDVAGMEKMQRAAQKMQHARMRDYFSYYDSPTEAMARGFGNELMIRGMGAIGNELGNLFDDARGIGGPLRGETGAARVITEVAAGMIGKVVSGAISGAPVGDYNATQTDMAMAVMEQASRSVQTIQNYIMDNLSQIASELDDDWEMTDSEDSTSLDMDTQASAVNFNADSVAGAFSNIGEYLHIISVGNESYSTAQELGIQDPDGIPNV